MCVCIIIWFDTMWSEHLIVRDTPTSIGGNTSLLQTWASIDPTNLWYDQKYIVNSKWRNDFNTAWIDLLTGGWWLVAKSDHSIKQQDPNGREWYTWQLLFRWYEYPYHVLHCTLAEQHFTRMQLLAVESNPCNGKTSKRLASERKEVKVCFRCKYSHAVINRILACFTHILCSSNAWLIPLW